MKGNRVIAKRPNGSSIMRTTAHLNKVPVQNGQLSLSIKHQASEKTDPLVWNRPIEPQQRWETVSPFQDRRPGCNRQKPRKGN